MDIDVTKHRPGPGDLFVLQLAADMADPTEADFDRIKSQLAPHLNGAGLVVLPPGCALRAATPYVVREQVGDYTQEVSFATRQEMEDYAARLPRPGTLTVSEEVKLSDETRDKLMEAMAAQKLKNLSGPVPEPPGPFLPGATVTTTEAAPEADWLCELMAALSRPNPEQTWGTLMAEVTVQAREHGAAYLWLVPNTFGVTSAVWLLPSAFVGAPDRGRYPFRGTLDGKPAGQVGPGVYMIPAREVRVLRAEAKAEDAPRPPRGGYF